MSKAAECRVVLSATVSPSLILDFSLSSRPSVSLHQVEQFKQDPSPSKCLHSVFHVDTGDEVYAYGDYHHLQVSRTHLQTGGDQWREERGS